MDSELDKQIQQSLNEWFKLKDEARPLKARFDDPNDPHNFTDEELGTLLAPSKKFEELYVLLCQKYPGLPPEE